MSEQDDADRADPGVRAVQREMEAMRQAAAGEALQIISDAMDMSDSEHGSGVVAEAITIPGESHPLLVSDDGSHLYFRGNVYQLEAKQ